MKRRKLKLKKCLKLLSVISVIIFLTVFFSNEKKAEEEPKPILSSSWQSFLENRSLSEYILSPSEVKGLDLKKLSDEDYISFKRAIKPEVELHSYSCLLVDLENRDAIYSLHSNESVHPASLTKLMTLDVILNLYHEDLDRTSSFSDDERWELIEKNASLADFNAEQDYTIRDLLYGLILPSGADAAKGLENLCEEDGFFLLDKMNERAEELGLENSFFVNTTGLHDENHFMSAEDIFKVIWDVMKYPEGKKILSSMEYDTEDQKHLKSTLYGLTSIEEVTVLGGKTGFTGEAGENIFVYFIHNEKPYALILTNAQGNPYDGEMYHFDDVISVVKMLYSSSIE